MKEKKRKNEKEEKNMKVMMMETGYFVMDDKEGRGAGMGIEKKEEGSDKRRGIKMNGLLFQRGEGVQKIG